MGATSKWHFFSWFPSGSPKIGIFVVSKFWRLISSSKQAYLEHVKTIFYSLQKDLFNNLHALRRDHLTHVLMGFVVESQIPNFTSNLFFNHNSCILGLNEHCEGTLGIYTSRHFQWYHKGSIWCLFSFSTKALNIQDSHRNATPKVGVHLGIIGLHLLHSPSFVRVCFTPEHTLLNSWALALYI